MWEGVVEPWERELVWQTYRYRYTGYLWHFYLGNCKLMKVVPEFTWEQLCAFADGLRVAGALEPGIFLSPCTWQTMESVAEGLTELKLC